ncbi:protein MpBHLH45 [Marchantia polymorpha subsp. ruderalis]|uniref:BHLH domain-containing protein n=2 Tax=Marchantia polymorpha TaxID=3197 RepID=A0A2R6WV93_MARPO|nr:hypothetical protein MARPO_0055s0052 [Marchantia polymorpha]BBN03012.1 hypothetical protein Mp_2g19970 [Marchantia polymorpha subsp. ruderalis]|eukprot:PTQ37775.1 hypothetical protein MARPO_0055s0052 [Marchantia polymorpha]
MATLASSIPVWAHLLTSDSGVVEHGQLPRSTSDAFTDCGSSPLSQHWETHEMDYSSHFIIPPQAHLTSNSHMSPLQWANAPDAAHHASLLQHCSDYQQQQQQQQQQQLEIAHHQQQQDQHPHLLRQAKSHVNHLADSHEDSRDSKRPAPSMGAQEELANSEAFIKRPRLEQQQQQQQQQTPNVPFKMQVRKEKLGERITALQQLVSPFGKTDTASVLLEAIGYIKFLQEQVQVLSTPYMKSNVGPSSMHHDNPHDVSKMGWASTKVKSQDDARQDLRSRGLCLVPVSCTLQVANDNGADFWTPAIGGSCR